MWMEPKSGSRLMPADGMHVAIEISKGDFGTSNRQLYKLIHRFCTLSNIDRGAADVAVKRL